MPKRVQTKFTHLYVLPANGPLPPLVLEYLQKVPVTTDEPHLTLWADKNRDLSAPMDQLLNSREFTRLFVKCDDCFPVPNSLPHEFWVVTAVPSIMSIRMLAIVFDRDHSTFVANALLGKAPLRWDDGRYLFGCQLWRLESKDVYSSKEELSLLFHDALFKAKRRLERMKGRVCGDTISRSNQVRSEIPVRVRTFVWDRDGGRCVQCGSQVDLEFDHIIPVTRGGSNTERNIQILCAKCNLEKGSDF